MARKLSAAAIANITKRMRAVPKELQRAAEAELLRSGENMAKDMRRDAPEDDGDLRDSIAVKPIEDEADQVVVRVSAGDEKAFYANMVEFGTKGTAAEASRQDRRFRRTAVMTKGSRGHAATPAQPFFFPNYRRHKKRVRTALLRVLRNTAKKLEQ